MYHHKYQHEVQKVESQLILPLPPSLISHTAWLAVWFMINGRCDIHIWHTDPHLFVGRRESLAHHNYVESRYFGWEATCEVLAQAGVVPLPAPSRVLCGHWLCCGVPLPLPLIFSPSLLPSLPPSLSHSLSKH